MTTSERYTHGHHAAVVAAHSARTAQNSAAFLLPQLRTGQRLLDVGCGPGSITVDLAGLIDPGEVVGIDAAAGVLEQARPWRPSAVANVRFEQADCYALPFDDATFDVAYAHQVLQHVARPLDALREMWRVLRPGGLLAVRDADYGTMMHAPHDPRLDRWLRLYDTVARHGGEPNAALPARLVQQAGFVDDVDHGVGLDLRRRDGHRHLGHPMGLAGQRGQLRRAGDRRRPRHRRRARGPGRCLAGVVGEARRLLRLRPRRGPGPPARPPRRLREARPTRP
ncbi:MAG: methyltransferase domain-containing protein [Acidimicrobiales bacterium]